MNALKIVALLLLLAASAAGGAYLYSRFAPVPVASTPAPEVITKTVTRRITATCPQSAANSGETVPSVVVETHENEATTLSATAPLRLRTDWSLAVSWDARRAFDGEYLPTSVELGRRTFGDLWLTGEWNWRGGSVLVGVRYEW
jgi:hypothetical protein